MTLRPYNRQAAVDYAHRWAYLRNPDFYNFDELGGDCTNFASQCLYAGAGVMNYTPTFGWYYNSQYSRTPPGRECPSFTTSSPGERRAPARWGSVWRWGTHSPATLSSCGLPPAPSLTTR